MFKLFFPIGDISSFYTTQFLNIHNKNMSINEMINFEEASFGYQNMYDLFSSERGMQINLSETYQGSEYKDDDEVGFSSQKNNQAFDLEESNMFNVLPFSEDLGQSTKKKEKKSMSKVKRGNKLKPKVKSTTKNILINFRGYFVKYIKSRIPEAYNDPFIKKFETSPSIHRENYTELFKKMEYRKVIKEMFEERFLQRQLQISRVSQEVMSIYFGKIKVFELAFERQQFPRIC